MGNNVYTSDVTVDTASKDQLVESIRLRQQRMAANVDELVGRVHPKTLAHKAQESAKGVVVDPQGSVKTDRVALIGGGVLLAAAALTFFAIRRSKRG